MGTQLRIYLDWNATAPLRPEARKAVLSALDVVGNPSSVHGEGRAARRLVEGARADVARLAGASPEAVVFTAGATEANMLALTPEVAARSGAPASVRLLVSAIEHPSARSGGRFPADAVEVLPATPDGVIDLAALDAALVRVKESGEGFLVSVMAVNNETGAIQPLREVADKVHEAGGLLHADAAQAPGKISLDIKEMGADLLTLSAHKMGGPQGVGALVLADEGVVLPALVTGGGQESGRRAGTENVAGIAGFGAAAAVIRHGLPFEAAHAGRLRDRLEEGLRAVAPQTVIFGETVERAPNTTLFAVRGIKAETAVIALDLIGIAVSSGSACSSGKVAPSHVLAAMGVEPALAAGAIRVSLGRDTSENEIDRFLEAWRNCVGALGKQGMGQAA